MAATMLACVPARAADPAPAGTGTGTAFKAKPDMQAVLDQLAALGGKPIETLTPGEARQQPTPADAVKVLVAKLGKPTEPTAMVPGISSVDRDIPGPGGPIPVRVYTPAGAGMYPVIVYFHGGGWVIADKDVYDGGARGLAKMTQAIVISADYRRAPEAKFPAAWDDALAVYRWTAQNAPSISGDPKRLALAGESAGGTLAVATAIAARDAGLQKPTHVLAVYPVTQTGDLATKSYVDSGTAKPLNKAMIEWFVDKLFARPDDKADPRVDLVHAKLAGLPPVTIINAQIDPLREDGALLATALKKAGVKTNRKVYNGVTHEFFGMAAVVKDAAAAQKFGGQAIAASFAQ